MKFMNELEKQTNIAITENGAVGYATTFNTLLDFNFQVPSFRHKEDVGFYVREVINSVTDLETLYRYIFFLRDARGGMGERRLFRAFIRELALMRRQELVSLIPLVAEYGRWDDLFVLKNTPFEQHMVDEIIFQLKRDSVGISENKPISLLAKWMPSNNASCEETKELAKFFASKLHLTAKQYRKLLSHMRYYLKVIEAQISREEYDKIDYSRVPSLANLRYGRLFLDKDYQRRMKFLSSLGKGETKVNSSVLYPYNVVAKVRRQGKPEPLTQGLWDGLREVGCIKNTLVVVDVSGSMGFLISGNVEAMDASIGLGIYFAERNSGEFKDKVITFSSEPKFVDLKNCKSIFDKVRKVERSQWSMDTNIEKVFDLVLKTAVGSKCSQDEIPNILIISDMEFNYCVHNGNTYTFDNFKKRFQEFGYELPKVTFWNLRSRSGSIPMTENSLGVALVSGYSPTCVKAVMSGKLDPYGALMDCIFVERYDKIAEAIKDYACA